ncbi:UDP-N-acetylmuramoyl-L-alanine--D-glutamate ligase [Magnetospira sp. QH-2]|uniref:UDP-N-acetylmuramoyl-L-alanine--D-glutamate ligase n=1 Tax=Magnetospira sp. (strain QH-2) TaxID=1288970 RepID=UPI0003E81659|nr:UDP-N-acetylmuramoyl-L-alanine--D-glutamate ligase [Magnetospira sp. QH-2]CCQ72806.1 UDP-N-acetylmuramoylalanine-D-glutamate ligase [Magnetospira sp. QH-2]
MIPVTSYRSRKVAVLGLGRSGRSTARSLRAGGAEVLAWDDAETARAALAADGIDAVDPAAWPWSDIAALVLSPGIPHTHPTPHPVATAAKAAQVPIIGDVDLLFQACPEAAFIGITGTNGKSTTTALVGHILELAGRAVQVGGNLGTPVLDLAPLGADGIYVLEMSSYQLELTPNARFDVAALLNITPDHLDRHGGFEGYKAAKLRIFENQPDDGVAVIGIDDSDTASILNDLRESGASRRLFAVSGEQVVESGCHAVDGQLTDATETRPMAIRDLRAVPTLPGSHNAQNAATACAIARAVGVPPYQIGAGIGTYPGLPHRQEPVALINGISYVNDSKATNPEAAARALASYDSVYWIAGGRAKDGPLEALTPYLSHVRHAYLIGEAAPRFAAELGDRIPTTLSGDLPHALRAAHERAEQNGVHCSVVLLSPACASFDQFASFEDRGDAFRQLVHELESAA